MNESYVHELVKILTVLASPYLKQRQYVMTMSIDELALEYDDIFRMRWTVELDEELEKNLVRIDKLFDQMSEDPLNWNNEALQFGESWKEIRRYAELGLVLVYGRDLK